MAQSSHLAHESIFNLGDLSREQLIRSIERIASEGYHEVVKHSIESIRRGEISNNGPASEPAPAPPLPPKCDGELQAHEMGDNTNVIQTKKAQTKAEKQLSKKQKKEFDMKRFRQRHVAIQLQYEGGPYFGFASQSGECEETIEKHLFEALTKLKLIENRQSCNYSRCGRTDKGVSALGQVVAFSLRSAMPLNVPQEAIPKHPCDTLILSSLQSTKNSTSSSSTSSSSSSSASASCSSMSATPPSHSPSKKRKSEGDDLQREDPTREGEGKDLHQVKEIKELDYCGILNKTLPENIRAIGWSPVTSDFNSRFSASHRTYRYFFLKKSLNIQAMQRAASFLIGEHDFKNLCKMDIANVTNFRREIFSAEILPFMENKGNEEQSVWMLQIKGIAFLWHMVRCIMAVLFLVGKEGEDPEVVKQLLDVDTCTAKPQYVMAPELPLVLHECGFDNLIVHKQPRTLWSLTAHFEALLERHLIGAARAMNSLQHLLGSKVRVKDVQPASDFYTFLMSKMTAKDDKKTQRKAKGSIQTGAGSNEHGAMDIHKPEGSEQLKYPQQSHASGAEAKRIRIDDSEGAGQSSNIGNNNNSSSSNSISTDSNTPVDGNVDDLVEWSHVLAKVYEEHNLTPSLLSPAPYVPLMQRPRGETYNDRREQLGGTRKERLQRHLELHETSSERNQIFFQKMRQQGNE